MHLCCRTCSAIDIFNRPVENIQFFCSSAAGECHGSGNWCWGIFSDVPFDGKTTVALKLYIELVIVFPCYGGLQSVCNMVSLCYSILTRMCEAPADILLIIESGCESKYVWRICLGVFRSIRQRHCVVIANIQVGR